MGDRRHGAGAGGEGDINFVDRGSGFVRSKPTRHHTAPTVAPRAQWPDPKGFAPCRRPPRPTGKERDSIAFVVVDAAAVAAAAAAVVVVLLFVAVSVVVVAVVRFSLLDAEWGAGMISSLSSGVVAGSRCLHVGDAGVKSLWGVSRWRM